MDDRISAWLENLGLGTYREAFQKNAITWDVLPELNQGDLETLGVLLGHRKQLLRAIAQLLPHDDVPRDRKSTRLNSSHIQKSRMPSSA